MEIHDLLKKPFKPGTVIPSIKTQGKWYFTFVDGDGDIYYNKFCEYSSAVIAKSKMREFIKIQNEQ